MDEDPFFKYLLINTVFILKKLILHYFVNIAKIRNDYVGIVGKAQERRSCGWDPSCDLQHWWGSKHKYDWKGRVDVFSINPANGNKRLLYICINY